MGKDLRGRECGTGLSQRKDKQYSAIPPGSLQKAANELKNTSTRSPKPGTGLQMQNTRMPIMLFKYLQI